MAEFTNANVTLGFDDSGETDLPPLVLFHGLSSARSTWHRLTPALAGRHRLLTLDARGHGDSDHAPGTYNLAHYVPDAIAFMEDRLDQPAVLIGHSLGGVIAACVARDRPDLVRGVLLEDPPLFVGAGEIDEASPVIAMFRIMQQLLTEMQARNASEDEYEALLRAAPSMHGGTMADALGEAGTRAQAKAMASLDPGIFASALGGDALEGANPEVPLACPTVVLRADEAFGAVFTAENASNFLTTNPDATVVEIERASHLIHDDQPDRFLEEVEAFLKLVG